MVEPSSGGCTTIRVRHYLTSSGELLPALRNSGSQEPGGVARRARVHMKSGRRHRRPRCVTVVTAGCGSARAAPIHGMSDVALLRSVSIFQTLEESALRQLAARCVSRDVRRGQRTVHDGRGLPRAVRARQRARPHLPGQSGGQGAGAARRASGRRRSRNFRSSTAASTLRRPSPRSRPACCSCPATSSRGSFGRTPTSRWR